MPEIQVFNTLGREKQAFTPRTPGRVTMYSCGPTVYKYSHIGNFRSYLMSDFWVRALQYLGLEVEQARNITDVGHLVDDTSDSGEDKVLAAARAEGKSPEEIAQFYTDAFHADAALLRMRPPDHEPRATEFVPQMIELIQALEAKGYTYTCDGNVFFDVQKKRDYPKLSGNTLDQLQAGFRIEPDPRKHHPADFALWKAGEERRLQVWDSPWGPGFPGWHIECSAMSLHYFPDGFDIHTGGVDNIFPHHEDEIAQSDSAEGRQMVKYWIHGEFLQLGGLKMAKSTGNIIRVSELEEMGFDPLAFRYLYLEAKYRTPLSFSEDVLAAAQRGLDTLRARASRLAPAVAPESAEATALEGRFAAALADDLDLPQAAALVHETIRANIAEGERRALLERWDSVLQLDLFRAVDDAAVEIPSAILDLARQRDTARAARDFGEADRLRGAMEEAGFAVEDTPDGTRLVPRRG